MLVFVQKGGGVLQGVVAFKGSELARIAGIPYKAGVKKLYEVVAFCMPSFQRF